MIPFFLPHWRVTCRNSDSGRTITLRAVGDSRDEAVDDALSTLDDFLFGVWTFVEAVHVEQGD